MLARSNRLLRSTQYLIIGAFALLAVGVTVAGEKNWAVVQVPEVWRSPPDSIATEGQGFAWFRCRFHVPENWRGKPYTLLAESADEAREYYLNGTLIATTGEFPPTFRSGLGSPEEHAVPADTLRAGDDNILAVRLFLNDARTNFNVAAPVVVSGDEAIHLQGAWEFSAGDLLAQEAATTAGSEIFQNVIAADKARAIWKLLEGDAGPQSIEDSLNGFQLGEGLALDCAVGEPHVRQPLSVKFDARGRMWVLQYLQYPNPAGLTMVSRDKHLRTVWDKVPPPPPEHFRGADTISIHEDTDGDGRFDHHKTFVSDLNLATSFDFDRDGLWVLNPPYLLFYPDHDHDDQPDGAPEVHLEGFGLEDSHSITNSLRWGPDGWLYASQGSTVTGQVKRWGVDEPRLHSMGQLIWRYHPPTRRYEIFAEGGGNAFGVEFDKTGRVYSGHNGGDTRGFHYVQGGYYQKGFGKHGELSNPYAFGYFPQMAHHAVPRFTHTFVIYQAASLPSSYHEKLFGVAPLLSHVVISAIEPDRSSFKTHDVGHAMTTNDPWFRPVDIQLGPDGALYICDFYEQRIDHGSHYQGRIHKESGRIYRLRAKENREYRPVDLERLSSEQLVAKLADPNRWVRQTSQRLLRERRDQSVIDEIEQLFTRDEQQSVEALWAYNSIVGISDVECLDLLGHPHPQVRLWTVRLVCDDGEISSRVAEELKELARQEPSVHVRSQLASSARRLPAASALPIVAQLVQHEQDAADIHIPLLLWWAIESKAEQDRESVLALFANPSFWEATIVQQHLLERIMRRYASTGARRDLQVCAQLLKMAPNEELAKRLMAGFEQAFEGRLLTGLPEELVEQLAMRGGGSFVLRLRQGDAESLKQALDVIANESADRDERTLYMQVVSQVKHEAAVPVLLAVVESSSDDALRSTALTALQAFNDPTIAQSVIRLHEKLPNSVREVAQTLLASRPSWTRMMLESVEAGELDKEAITEDMVRRLLLHNDSEIAALVHSLWGDVQGASTEEMQLAMARLDEVIRQGSGNPYTGEVLFSEHCGKCHTLFNSGGKIGPDLTAYKRDDVRAMLANVVNPSLEIREGFENYLIVTVDGRALNGFLVDQDPQAVTLRSADGQSTTVSREDIEEMQAIPRSIMPAGLLDPLSEQQVRDLFAYLRATQPLP